MASERGIVGARLVALDGSGNRRFDLIAGTADTDPVREANPAVSPDGHWIVFASSRGGSLDHTALWIAPLREGARATRLVAGTAPVTESHPAWTRDGGAIVYASTAGGGDFDLWRVRVQDGHAVGAPERLSDRDGHEITPAVAPDGTIAFACVSTTASGTVDSHLEALHPDGTIDVLTDGPSDNSPAYAPDGKTLVFSRVLGRGDTGDAELWSMAPVEHGGAQAQLLVDIPLTDESGPVFSRDGRFVFATSVLRGEADRVIYASIVHVDLQEQPRVARVLTDRLGATLRLTPAIVAPRLDPNALHADPEYLPELRRIMAATIEAQRSAPP